MFLNCMVISLMSNVFDYFSFILCIFFFFLATAYFKMLKMEIVLTRSASNKVVQVLIPNAAFEK